MSLLELRKFVKEHQKTSLNDLKTHFKVDGEQIDAMMEIFVAKNQIKREELQSSCGCSCTSCHKNKEILYYWN